jgi:putative ABC transport system substrate-binding protein
MSSALFGLAMVACAGAVSAQVAKPIGAHIPRLCFLTFDPVSTGPSRYTPFFDRLRELGYLDGKTIALDWLSADGQAEHFPTVAADCVRRNADVIVTGSTPATLAAKQATTTIPIVMLTLGDPVGTGLVTSLARPDGNVTGTTNLAPLMMVKGLELLKETIPALSRALVLTYPVDPISRGQIVALQGAGKSLGVELLVHEVAGPPDFAPGFEAGQKAGVQAVVTTVESIFSVNRALLIGLTRSYKLPSLFAEDSFVKAGGLMSYDADRARLTNRTADFVDRLLKGAKPADLPIEQPAVFTIAVNAGTARALGIAIPPSVMARADEVIE